MPRSCSMQQHTWSSIRSKLQPAPRRPTVARLPCTPNKGKEMKSACQVCLSAACVRACGVLSVSLSLCGSLAFGACASSVFNRISSTQLFFYLLNSRYGTCTDPCTATAKRGEAGVVHTRKATARRLGPRLHVRGQRRLSKSTTQSETQPLLPCTVLKALKPWV